MAKTNRNPSKPNKRYPVLTTAGLVAVVLTIFALSQKSSRQKTGAPIEHSQVAQQRPTATSTSDLSPDRKKPEESSSLNDTDNSVRLVGEGNDLLRTGNIDEAILRFRKALIDDPEQEDVHFNLGIALAKAGRKEEAKAEYQEALRIYPEYAEAHNNLGNLLMAENKLAEARTHFEAAIQASPDSASAHNNLGTALARDGKMVEAIPYFSEAIHLQPDYPDARCNLANSYLAQNRMEEALTEFRTILKVHPDFKPALKGLERARAKR